MEVLIPLNQVGLVTAVTHKAAAVACARQEHMRRNPLVNLPIRTVTAL